MNVLVLDEGPVGTRIRIPTSDRGEVGVRAIATSGGGPTIVTASPGLLSSGPPATILTLPTVPANNGVYVQFTVHGTAGILPGQDGTALIELLDGSGLGVVVASLDRLPVLQPATQDNAFPFVGDNGNTFTLSSGLIALATVGDPLVLQVTLSNQGWDVDRAAAAFHFL